MSEPTAPTPTPSTPAPVAPTAATPPPQRGPAPLPSTAELLSQASAPKPVTAPGSTSGTSDGSAAAAPAGQPQDDSGKPADDVSLARIAREQRRLDAEKRALKDEKVKLTGAAADADAYRKLQTLKGTSKLAAIRELLGGDKEVDAAYWELNGDILNRAKPVSDEDKLAARVKAELAKAKLAEDDARKATDTEADAARVQAVEAATEAYVDRAIAAYVASPDKYPGLTHFPVDAETLMAFAEDHHAAKGQLPTADEVLAHFEADRQERLEKLRPAAKSAGTTTVTGKWGNDAPLKPVREQSLKEIHEEALREANITR